MADVIQRLATCSRQLLDAGAEIAKLRTELKEADELLEVAYYAHQKMGLEGCGDRGLSHEVRMFALHFSKPEKPKTPKHVIRTGDGRYWKFKLRRHPGAYEKMAERCAIEDCA